MKTVWTIVQCVVIAALVLVTAGPASAKDSGPGYQTGFTLWRGKDGGFAGWTLDGTALASAQIGGVTVAGALLTIDPGTAGTGSETPGTYYGKNFYNGGSFLVGEATSPEVSVPFAFTEAIASWNAQTPDGTWVETLARARIGDRWTKWYNLGVWASGTTTVQRHSVRLQGDADGYVAVDTLVLSKGKIPASALQVKVRLFQADGSGATPTVSSMSVAYSTAAPKVKTTSAGDPALWGTFVDVPECSQMVYPDGGNVWCSPTSTSMVLGYWTQDTGPCEPRVRAAVEGVYDWIYDGHGNWPFNTAYAASQGMEGYVARYTGLDRLEPWLAAGVPVVMSIAWNKGELTGAAVSSSNGHLIVLVGFDANGNAIVNDPAAASDADVQRTYLRGELEAIWLKNSGGTVYLIFPPGHAVPAF